MPTDVKRRFCQIIKKSSVKSIAIGYSISALCIIFVVFPFVLISCFVTIFSNYDISNNILCQYYSIRIGMTHTETQAS